MRSLALVLLIAACAAVPESGDSRLASELEGRVAGEPQACISGAQSQSLQAVDRRTIVLRTSEAVWVNRLAGECPGLSPMSTLIVETFSGRYCRGDRVRGVEAGRSIPGPSCPLGDFVPYRLP